MTSPTWTGQPGDILIRGQIHGAYGGNSQAGISRSSSSPNVLVYSDHEKAAANGYDFDGWDESKVLLTLSWVISGRVVRDRVLLG